MATRAAHSGKVHLSRFALLCWDGVLPSAVAATPAIVCHFFGRNHLAAWLAAVMVPVFASLIRASVGSDHLKHAGPPSIIRQIVFSAAVALLFALELISNIGQLSDPLPTEVWLLIITLYLIYFGLIVAALRPFPLCTLIASRG